MTDEPGNHSPEPVKPEPILVVGSGALACLFGARLAPLRPVIMLAGWPAGVQALQQHGIREQTENGWQSHPVQVVTDPDEVDEIRHAIVLVKAWQTRRAARQLSRCLVDDGLALTLQNGLGNREILAAELGEERVALGVTTYGANMIGPGRVRAAGHGAVQLGMRPGLVELADLLAEAGFEVEATDDVDGLVWGKLAVNAGINPVTALVGAPNGFVAEQDDARWLLETAVREVMAVAAALEVQLPQSDPVDATLGVARRTAGNRSSMLQDLERGAPTEIDAICGAVVRHGTEVGVATPANLALWRMVRAAAAAGDIVNDRDRIAG